MNFPIEEVRVFILCAGYGTRLKPITEYIPKPLIPLLGKPLLEHILTRLRSLRPKAIGLNAHHLAEQILSFSEKTSNIRVYYEKKILGTGGALKNAEDFLSEGTFLVHNGDVLAEIDYERALRFHKERGALATLVVCDIPWANNLVIDYEGHLLGVVSSESENFYTQGSLLSSIKRVGFTGIAFYEPKFLEYLPQGYSSVVEGWLKAIKAGETILTYYADGAWFDLGTPERYLQAVFYSLRKSGENLFIHPLAEVDELQFEGFFSIETEVKIMGRTFLKNVVVIAEKEKVTGSYVDGILFKEHFIRLSESVKNFQEERGFPVGFGGSERRFYRLSDSKLLMIDTNKDEVKRLVMINKLLRSKGINLPEILELRENEVIFQDLGDLSLYNFLKIHFCKIQRSPDILKAIFQKVLDQVVKFHLLFYDPEVVQVFPLFDRAYFRWETQYFEEKFLGFLCGLRTEEKLIREFERLAEIASSFPRNLIHRDLQSQNILIYRGEVYLIDYQGARLGPAGYDLASLVFDPYWEQPEDFRLWAIDYYIRKRTQLDASFDKELFLKSLPYLALQRHLQALSAYVNLSYFKGKNHFCKFIPRGLKYAIRDAEVLKEEFPVLRDYIYRCIEILLKRGESLSEEVLSV